jgi:hypothetical protein
MLILGWSLTIYLSSCTFFHSQFGKISLQIWGPVWLQIMIFDLAKVWHRFRLCNIKQYKRFSQICAKHCLQITIYGRPKRDWVSRMYNGWILKYFMKHSSMIYIKAIEIRACKNEEIFDTNLFYMESTSGKLKKLCWLIVKFFKSIKSSKLIILDLNLKNLMI